MMMKLVPLSAFSVYGVSTYHGRTYETIDGELYVAVDVEDLNINDALMATIQGETFYGVPDDDRAYYDEYLESWVKYSMYDEDRYLDENLSERDDRKIDNGVGYIFNQLANEKNEQALWCLFHDPNIHDRRIITELGEFGRERERFLRRWQTEWWAELTVNGELFRHCKEVEKIALNHISRLKEKFGNKYNDYKLKDDARQNIIYRKRDTYHEIGEDMYVESDLELPYGF